MCNMAALQLINAGGELSGKPASSTTKVQVIEKCRLEKTEISNKIVPCFTYARKE